MMELLFTFLVSLIAWLLVGCIALAIVDEHGHLLEWTDKAPFVMLKFGVVLLWPYVIYKYRKT